jgi:membrane associated rhomboid family serine protease
MFPIQDTIQARNAPIVTWIIILLNSVVFFFELGIPIERLEAYLMRFGMIPARLTADPRAWWTLVTCMFLHGGWMHFIGNMWTLYIFGDNVEDRMGPARFLIFYLLCGLAASLAHIWAAPSGMLPTIGASGAIAGALGAYFVMYPTARVITLVPIFFVPIFVKIPAVFFLSIWFITQLLSGTLSLVGPHQFQNVSWWAHVGGFVAGIILLTLLKNETQEGQRH